MNLNELKLSKKSYFNSLNFKLHLILAKLFTWFLFSGELASCFGVAFGQKDIYKTQLNINLF